MVSIILGRSKGVTLSFLLGGLALVWWNLSASSQNVSDTCMTPSSVTYLNYPLAQIAERVTKAQPIKVVAIGSSSTAGAGASSSTATFPSRLSFYLQERFPRNPITVLNRGVNGDEAVNMVVRFERDVIDEHPDLVLWQIGTNVVLRDHPLDSAGDAFARGVEKVESCGRCDIDQSPVCAKGLRKKRNQHDDRPDFKHRRKRAGKSVQ